MHQHSTGKEKIKWRKQIVFRNQLPVSFCRADEDTSEGPDGQGTDGGRALKRGGTGRRPLATRCTTARGLGTLAVLCGTSSPSRDLYLTRKSSPGTWASPQASLWSLDGFGNVESCGPLTENPTMAPHIGLTTLESCVLPMCHPGPGSVCSPRCLPRVPLSPPPTQLPPSRTPWRSQLLCALQHALGPCFPTVVHNWLCPQVPRGQIHVHPFKPQA